MEFSQITLLLVFASVFGIIAVSLKQPLVLGYIVGGVLLAKFNLIPQSPVFDSFGAIGVTLLLFLLGLEMNLKELPSVGRASISIGILQIILTSFLGFIICFMLGFSPVAALYIAIALTFSSTIVIVKLLSEKKDLGSLYGRISVGILLVQDFFAILILMFLSSSGKMGGGLVGYGFVFAKAFALFYLTWALSKKILPKLMDKVVSKSVELTFIFSIAWALGVAAFSAYVLDFTLEIGGFLAGLSLSGTSERLQVGTRARPLRDFFLTIFFLLLGFRLGGTSNMVAILPQALTLSVFVLIFKPIIIMGIMGYLGYNKRTSFFTSLSTAQISEFSLIIISLGAFLGNLPTTYVSLIIIVGVITMTLSTYMILGAGKIYHLVAPRLQIFEKKVTKEAAFLFTTDIRNHAVLVGCDRTGKLLLNYLKKYWMNKYVVVDFNPSVFRKLTTNKLPVIFGDIEDLEILEAANIRNSRLIISTISDLSANLVVLEYLKSTRSHITSIFTAGTRSEGIKLYEKGASFVIVPEMVAGDFIKHTLKIFDVDTSKFMKLGRDHFDRLILDNRTS